MTLRIEVAGSELDARHTPQAMPTVANGPRPPRAAIPEPGSVDLGSTLGVYRHGPRDPTTQMSVQGRATSSSGRFLRATHTPHGPGTIEITWTPKSIDISTSGPGGPWLDERAGQLMGADDTGPVCATPNLAQAKHQIVADAAIRHRHVRLGASGTLYHELLPTILEQRITSVEAHQQWRRLCIELGKPAPGGHDGLLLPPSPDALSSQPSWWFHPLGIENKRVVPLHDVARHASKLWEWAKLPPASAADKLGLLRGVGPWTIGCVLGPALGDPDAVAIGDYHLKNLVAYHLAGESRATDERMIELLEPYRGQRGRVIGLLARHGGGAPKFGPRQRILPMRSW